MNKWIIHVKQFANDNQLNYNEALKHPYCKTSYHSISGGTLKSGYIKKLIKNGSFDIKRMKTEPSKWLKNKYPEIMEQIYEQANEQHYDEPIMEQEQEPVYDDINVGRPKKKKENKAKDKSKLTEKEIERNEAKQRAEKKELDDKRVYLLQLKDDLKNCSTELGINETNLYRFQKQYKTKDGNLKKDASSLKKLKTGKDKNEDKIREIWGRYKELGLFIKKYKLNRNNLNDVHKFITEQQKKVKYQTSNLMQSLEELEDEFITILNKPVKKPSEYVRKEYPKPKDHKEVIENMEKDLKEIKKKNPSAKIQKR
jgi:hypothetical protein